MRRSLGLICVLLFAATLRVDFVVPLAQGDTRGFKLYSARVTGGFDTGIDTEVEGGDVVDESTLAIVPAALAYRNPAPRSTFEFIYEPEVEIFRHRSDLNDVNHAGAVAYERRVTPTLDFRTGGTVLRTHDRSRQSSGLAVTDRGLYFEGRGYLTFDYRFSRETRLRVDLTSWASRTEVAENVSTSGLVDEWSNSVGVGLARRFGRAHELSVDYTRLGTSVVNGEDLTNPEFVPSEAQDMINGGWQVTLLSGLRFGGSLGVIRNPAPQAEDEYTYAILGYAEKNWNTLTVGGSYRRSLSGLFRVDPTDSPDAFRDPLLNGGVADAIRFAMGGEIGRRVSIQQEVTLSRTDVPAADDRIESLFAGLSFGVALNDRIEPVLNILYWDQSSSVPTLDFSRTRITAGLRFYWDPLTSVRYGANREPARALLPTRGVGR